MTQDHAFLKDRILWYFRKGAGDGLQSTHPFDELPELTWTYLTETVRIAPPELGVLAFFRDQDCWTLVTTARVAWKLAGELKVFGFDELAKVTVDRAELTRSEGRAKSYLDRIIVETIDDAKYEAPAEAGSGLFAIWNALLLVIRRPEIPDQG